MGSSELVTAEEAARMLEVGKTTVYWYVRKGYLQPHSSSGPLHFSREVVNDLAHARDKSTDLKGVAFTAAQSLALSRMLERRMKMLETLIGSRAEGLPTDEENVLSLYAEAEDDLDEPPTSMKRVLYWAKIFTAIGEEFFDLLEAYTDSGQAWRSFVDLGVAISKSAPAEKFEVSPDLEAAYRYFEVGRNNLRNAAFLYVRNRYGSRTANKVFEEAVGNVHEEILAILSSYEKS